MPALDFFKNPIELPGQSVITIPATHRYYRQISSELDGLQPVQ